MIAAYPKNPSVLAGETLELGISTDRACSIRFVRCGAVLEWKREFEGTVIPAQHCAIGSAEKPWDWPLCRFQIPASWGSGVYVAMLTPSQSLDARDGRAMFIVRPKRPQSPVVYNVPLFTFAAYNVGLDTESERTCLYNSAPAVTLQRPGNGIGGHTWDERIVDLYDPATPRQTLAHWDLRAICWMESRFGAIDYLCDLDLHLRRDALAGYELLAAFGHHEYWSDAMRCNLQAHLQRGGNAAFFTGNTCFFRIRYDDCAAAISRIGKWSDWPEEQTFGVSYRYGGGKWRGDRPASGFSVLQPRHWIFDGCSIGGGEAFGGDARIVGYECDGVPEKSEGGFEPLAQCDISSWPVRDGSGELSAAARATLGIKHGSGELFAAGTVDWPRVLNSGEPSVERITSNILKRYAPSLV